MDYSFFHPYGPTSSKKEVPELLKNIKPKGNSFGKQIKKKRKKVKKRKKIKKRKKVKN